MPYRLSNMCLVSVSLTATIGNFSAPSAAIARSRITPVVVSSQPALTVSSSSVRVVCTVLTRSQPSSKTKSGRLSSAELMCS